MLKKYIKRIIHKVRCEVNIDQLINDGLKVGQNFRFNEFCTIDPSHCWLIEIGNDVVFAPKVHILAHDASMWNDTGYTRIAPVKIGDNVFVGAGAIIMPGVTLGNNVIVGAGSVVTKSFPNDSVIAGNPARMICNYEEYINRHLENQNNKPVYSEKYTARNKDLTDEMKKEMLDALKENGFGYVE